MAKRRNPRSHDQVRALSVRVLGQVLVDEVPLDQALERAGLELKDPAQRAWMTEVCSGVLRWKGRLDLAIDSIATSKKPSGRLRRSLYLGAYALVFAGESRVPAAMIVSETVDFIRQREGDAPARFGNALLRKLSDHADAWRNLPFPERGTEMVGIVDGARTIGENKIGENKKEKTSFWSEEAAWASMPVWIWKKLVNERGLRWACEYAQASLERPRIWVRARDREFKADWIDQSGPVSRSFLARASMGAVSSWQGFAEGRFIVQDIASQYLVEEVAGCVGIHDGKNKSLLKALDLCAAPGGKSVSMSWLGMDVIASDREADQGGEARLNKLRETLSRAAPQVRLVEKADLPSAAKDQNLVWVDAPCTGSGILRRHPDVKWLRKEEHVSSLQAKQRELLIEGWNYLKPGGYLVYSVCSVFKSEGAEQVDGWLAKLPSSNSAEHGRASGKKLKEWLIAPQDPLGGDGFYCALIEKES